MCSKPASGAAGVAISLWLVLGGVTRPEIRLCGALVRPIEGGCQVGVCYGGPTKYKASQKKGDLTMPEATDIDTIMKAACIQAAATLVALSARHDALETVTTAKQLLEQMAEQGYYSLGE